MPGHATATQRTPTKESGRAMNRSTENLRYTPSLLPKTVVVAAWLVAIAVGTVIDEPVGASDPQLLAEHLYNAANRPVMVSFEATQVGRISLALIDADASLIADEVSIRPPRLRTAPARLKPI